MFYIDENNSIRYGSVLVGSGEDGFDSAYTFDSVAQRRGWSKQTVTDVWNGFAGTAGPFADLKPCKCFRNRPYGLGRIWEAIQRLVPAGSASEAWQPDSYSETAAPIVNATSEPTERAEAEMRECLCCNGTGEEDGDSCGNCMGAGEVAYLAPEQSTTPILDEEVKVKPAARKPKKSAKKTAKPAPVVVVKEGSNVEVLIRLASRKHGVSVDEAMKATGWTSCHSVRGRFSVLGSKGMNIERTKHATRGTVYRLVA